MVCIIDSCTQKVRVHNPWYGSSFFHSQSDSFGGVMRYVRIAVGYSGIYLFYVDKDEVSALGRQLVWGVTLV